MWLTGSCRACSRQVPAEMLLFKRTLIGAAPGRGYGLASASQAAERAVADAAKAKELEDNDPETRRRRKRVEEKRRQKGASFIDHMIVTVRGGKGGAGSAAFEATRSSALGLPSGGNGGPGGSVYITTSPHLTSLTSVKKRLVAAQGGNGAGSWRHGRKGTDLIVQVPVGTVVKEMRRETEEERVTKEEEMLNLSDEDKKKRRRDRMFVKHPMGEVQEEDFEDAEMTLQREGRYHRGRSVKTIETVEIIDLDISRPLAEPLLLYSGGTGGLGNPHFHVPSSGNAPTLPRLASRGQTPPTLTLTLELKLLADVGLVGFPNAGKSTILRALTGSKAEVAGYQFTTLNPQVGVVRVWDDGTYGGIAGGIVEESWKERAAEVISDLPRERRERKVESMRFTISDNPGLLPEAHQNYGLGHSFLRSIERSLALCYVLDLTRADPGSDLRALVRELEEYKEGLGGKSRVVVVNKADEVDEAAGKAKLAGVLEAIEEIKGDHAVDLVTVSGKYGLGLDSVVTTLAKHVTEARRIQAEEEARLAAEAELL